MSDRISIPALRRENDEGRGRSRSAGDDVLALVEAVEAAHVYYLNDEFPGVPIEIASSPLAEALDRFDFGEQA